MVFKITTIFFIILLVFSCGKNNLSEIENYTQRVKVFFSEAGYGDDFLEKTDVTSFISLSDRNKIDFEMISVKGINPDVKKSITDFPSAKSGSFEKVITPLGIFFSYKDDSVDVIDEAFKLGKIQRSPLVKDIVFKEETKEFLKKIDSYTKFEKLLLISSSVFKEGSDKSFVEIYLLYLKKLITHANMQDFFNEYEFFDREFITMARDSQDGIKLFAWVNFFENDEILTFIYEPKNKLSNEEAFQVFIWFLCNVAN